MLGGLWLADGRRRGAVLAVSMDGLRILALLFVGAIGSLSFVISLALAIAAVGVWPQLEPPSTPRGVLRQLLVTKRRKYREQEGGLSAASQQTLSR